MFSSYCNLNDFLPCSRRKKAFRAGFRTVLEVFLKLVKNINRFLAYYEKCCVVKELNYLTSKNFSSYHLLTPLFSLAAIAILIAFSSEAVSLLSFPLAALVAMAMLYKCCVFTALLLRGFNLIGIKTYFDSVHEEKGCFRRFYGFIYKFS